MKVNKTVYLMIFLFCRIDCSSNRGQFGGGGDSYEDRTRINDFGNGSNDFANRSNNVYSAPMSRPPVEQQNNSFNNSFNRSNDFNFADSNNTRNNFAMPQQTYQQPRETFNANRSVYKPSYQSQGASLRPVDNSFDNNRPEYREQQPVNNSFDFANRNNNFNFANRQDSYFHQNQLLVQQNLPTQANTISQTSATNPVNTPSQTNPVNSSVAVNQSTVNNPASITTPANTTNPTNPTNTVTPTIPVNTPSQTNPVNSSVAVNQSTVNNPASITTQANMTTPTPATNPTNPTNPTNALTANTYSLQDIQNANTLLVKFLIDANSSFMPNATDLLGAPLKSLVDNKQFLMQNLSDVLGAWRGSTFYYSSSIPNYTIYSFAASNDLYYSANTPQVLVLCETMAAEYIRQKGAPGWSLNWYNKLTQNIIPPLPQAVLPQGNISGYMPYLYNILNGQTNLFNQNNNQGGLFNYMQQGADGNYYVVVP